MKILKTFILGLLIVVPFLVKAQETLPIYSDYLSDNVYLVHPSAAGIGNCGKFRLTARNQWAGIEDAPSLQTLSFHTRIGDYNGVGLILFNDKNGFHSQQGVQLTYAYHIDLDRENYTNQLSFGMSFMAVNNKLDQSSFIIPDPVISQIVESTGYFNADFGMAYHYLTTLGYYYGEGKSFQLEPSIMGQLIERTGEKFVDFNLKIYKDVADAQLWLAMSYRRGFDGNDTEELNYLTPIIGINYKNYMFSYTYTKQTGDILFDDAGYHQISLGINLFCKAPRTNGCPNINASF